MPLRDHFRPPLDDRFSWDGLHGGWPAMMVQALSRKLPRRFIAFPSVHLSSSIEVDVATFEQPNRYSIGMRHVLVNGKSVVANGAITAERPGRPLRGAGYRDSR